MTSTDKNQAIYWLFMQVMFQAKHRLIQIAEVHGLTLMQANVLVMLEPGEPMAMNFISTAFVCDASNVTGIVDRLVRQGLIERQDHPTDRRIKMISLTAHGTELKKAMTAEVVAAETERLEPVLDDAERQALKNLLQKILASTENAQ